MVQLLHIFVISSNFFAGIAIVLSIVLIRMPKQITAVSGGTNFL